MSRYGSENWNAVWNVQQNKMTLTMGLSKEKLQFFLLRTFFFFFSEETCLNKDTRDYEHFSYIQDWCVINENNETGTELGLRCPLERVYMMVAETIYMFSSLCTK